MRTAKEEQLEIASANISLLLAIMAGKVKTDGRHGETTIDGLFELKGTGLIERDGRYYQLTKDGKNRLREAIIDEITGVHSFISSIVTGDIEATSLVGNEVAFFSSIQESLGCFLPPPRQGKVED